MQDVRKRIVRDAYEATAGAFARARRVPGPEAPWVARLLAGLSPASSVLDLGCGNGEPIARALAAAGHHVTGVDLAPEQVRRAAACVPGGTFLVGDMTAIELPPGAFRGAIAWDAPFHVPPEEHPALYARIRGWLRRGAPLVISLGDAEGELYTTHLGAPIYYGSIPPPDALAALVAAGFHVLDQRVDDGRLAVLAAAL